MVTVVAGEDITIRAIEDLAAFRWSLKLEG
jgi:hypothetical protein